MLYKCAIKTMYYNFSFEIKTNKLIKLIYIFAEPNH